MSQVLFVHAHLPGSITKPSPVPFLLETTPMLLRKWTSRKETLLLAETEARCTSGVKGSQDKKKKKRKGAAQRMRSELSKALLSDPPPSHLPRGRGGDAACTTVVRKGEKEIPRGKLYRRRLPGFHAVSRACRSEYRCAEPVSNASL